MRGALKTFVALNPEWTVCGEAGNANEAIAKAQELHPDVIILDYKMPDSDGLVAADGIFRALPDIPIVMFTLFNASSARKRAFHRCSAQLRMNSAAEVPPLEGKHPDIVGSRQLGKS